MQKKKKKKKEKRKKEEIVQKMTNLWANLKDYFLFQNFIRIQFSK